MILVLLPITTSLSSLNPFVISDKVKTEAHIDMLQFQ